MSDDRSLNENADDQSTNEDATTGNNFKAPAESSRLALPRIIGQLPEFARFFVVSAIVVEILLGIMGFLFQNESNRLIVIAIIACILFAGMLFVYMLQRQDFSNSILVPIESQGESNGKVIRYDYDVFIATAIAALSDTASLKQRMLLVEEIVGTIRGAAQDKLRIFCATARISSQEDFDDEAIAFKNNVKRMRASKYLILFYFESLPTSALVEVGMALALNKNNIWFVKRGVILPYLLRGATSNLNRDANMPSVRQVEFSDEQDLKNKIKKNFAEYFDLT